MEAVLDDLGPDLGELGDLMPEGLGVVSVEGMAAAVAGMGLDLDGVGQSLGGDQLARAPLVACPPRRFREVGLGGCRLT